MKSYISSFLKRVFSSKCKRKSRTKRTKRTKQIKRTKNKIKGG